MCCEQSGSSAVNEQRAQTHIALFGDLSQSTLFGTGALVGSEAQPGSEMTARGEALDIADDGASKRIKQLRWGREPRAARWFNRRASTVSLFKYLLNGKRDYTGLFPNNAPHSSPARHLLCDGRQSRQQQRQPILGLRFAKPIAGKVLH